MAWGIWGYCCRHLLQIQYATEAKVQRGWMTCWSRTVGKTNTWCLTRRQHLWSANHCSKSAAKQVRWNCITATKWRCGPQYSNNILNFQNSKLYLWYLFFSWRPYFLLSLHWSPISWLFWAVFSIQEIS